MRRNGWGRGWKSALRVSFSFAMCKDTTMANVEKKGYVDAGWPTDIPEGRHAVTELVADTAGALSPYDDIEFPVDASELPYVHSFTVINK